MQTVLVAAGVLVRGGRVLLTQRKAGTHLAALWEFPGGKVEAGEDPKDALVRELREEIGVEALVGEIVCVTFHRYEDAGKAVLLLFYRVDLQAASAEPRALDVADLAWSGPEGLDPARFPPADHEVLAKVRELLGAS
jgi:8-oxo-dGTP diphosphatase